MSEQIVLNEEDSTKVARALMRSAIEVNRLGESFDTYRETAKQSADAHDEPNPDYAHIRKLDEDRAAMAEYLVDTICGICKWDAP
jgi:hypothetical protein